MDFLNGSSGAKGAENEEVLLLDETVRNKTVPLILCAEEDVEGSHGASIGRIDETQIFYMQSRGIPVDKIYELTARSRIAQVVSKISDKDTADRVNAILTGGEEDG
ncbi:MAG: SufD family Fe-S cluster assembly protein [Ruminococcus sp.]|nr:SufD family Fe-S cluster assembly protein [Ruminococcus sp.]